MNRGRSIALGVLTWLGIVALVSGLVWTVISQAGARVASTSTLAPSADVSVGGPSVPPGPGAASVRPSASGPGAPSRSSGATAAVGAPRASQRATSTASQSAAPPVPSSARPTPEPAPVPTAKPSPKPTPKPSPKPTSKATSKGPVSGGSGPVAIRGTWQGPGGRVVAECTGAAISVVSAQADLGFRVGVAERGPSSIEVEFEGQDEEAGRGSHVAAQCVGGTPGFSVESESGSGRDGRSRSGSD